MPIGSPRAAWLVVLATVCAVAWTASATAQESQFASDVRRQKQALRESCKGFKSVGSCAMTLFTSYPFHLMVGGIAPQSLFGGGIAVSERYTPNETWRLTFSGDAMMTITGSQRLGGYVKFIHTPPLGVVARRPGDPPVRPRLLRLDTWAADVFAQQTTLDSVNFHGVGRASLASDRTVFGERQTQIGGSVVLPMSGRSWLGALNPALLGGISARMVDIRPGDPAKALSIEQRFDDTSAPGLSLQDPFIELREGVRLRPALPTGELNFDYTITVQQFITSEESRSSFGRLTFDLKHEFPLYREVASTGPQRDFNGPNECSRNIDTMECPSVRLSRNRSGSINVRGLVVLSHAPGDNQVPFYFQPTLGGANLNSDRLLQGFADYRFRAPNMFVLQESVEHSIWGPIGFFAMAEQGKVTERRSQVDFADLMTSTALGVTFRAGGFPMMSLSYGWGAEGRHIMAIMNTGLLGGSARPSLF